MVGRNWLIFLEAQVLLLFILISLKNNWNQKSPFKKEIHLQDQGRSTTIGPGYLQMKEVDQFGAKYFSGISTGRIYMEIERGDEKFSTSILPSAISLDDADKKKGDEVSLLLSPNRITTSINLKKKEDSKDISVEFVKGKKGFWFIRFTDGMNNKDYQILKK